MREKGVGLWMMEVRKGWWSDQLRGMGMVVVRGVLGVVPDAVACTVS